MKSTPLVFAIWLLSSAFAALHSAPFPQDATVSLQFPEHLTIGDLVVGKFVVQNNGATSLQFAFWDELNVEVKDGQGRPLPHIPRSGMAGFAAVPTVIESGKSKSLEFLLPAFVNILAPGTYSVSAWSSLGWDKDGPHPVATAKIQFHSPTPAHAAASVHQLCTKPAPRKTGDKITAYNEIASEAHNHGVALERLRDPQYLAPLLKEVKAGNLEACFGIASIPGIEPSEILLKLAHSPDAKIANAAMHALVGRLSSPERNGSQDFASIFHGELDTIKAAWPAKLDARLMALAENILHHTQSADWPAKREERPPEDYFDLSNNNMVSAAAYIVASRGTLAQVPALMDATNHALSAHLEPRTNPDDSFYLLPEPLRALLNAIDALRHRGWVIKPIDISSNPPLEGSGGRLVLLRQLADPEIPKPEDDHWKEVVAEHLTDQSTVIKQNALQAIPPLFPADWDRSVIAALEDPDLAVVVAACRAAGASGRKSFVRPLAQAIESVHESLPGGTREAATKAAVQLGGGAVVWESWANLLIDEQCMQQALRRLCNGTIDLPPERGSNTAVVNRSQRFLLRDAWREFLQKHHDLLERGERVPRDDVSITPTMIGLSFGDSPIISLDFADGTKWPNPDPSKTAPSIPGLPK